MKKDKKKKKKKKMKVKELYDDDGNRIDGEGSEDDDIDSKPPPCAPKKTKLASGSNWFACSSSNDASISWAEEEGTHSVFNLQRTAGAW